MESYYAVSAYGQEEIVEKKSRFIARVYPVTSEEEALICLEDIRKRFWDARHHCYAYVLGKNSELQRFSDDGELQGTAGKPILEALTGSHMHDTLIIVTRYFGGTLLGTGGLVRAYGSAARAGLRAAKVVQVCNGISFRLELDYNSVGKMKYLLGQMEIAPENETYGTSVIMDLTVKAENFPDLKAKITDATSGNAVFSEERETEFRQKVETFSDCDTIF